MNLSGFYKHVIELGAQRDPRAARESIRSYADTDVLYGKPGTKVEKIMAGIDIDVSDLLLADNLRRKEGLDLVLSHHPQGAAWARFYEVMMLQVDMLVEVGLPKDVARALIEERKCEVERRVSSSNHMRCVDAARLLDLAFMCAHTPADNQVSFFLQGLLRQKKPARLQDIVEILNDIPEYRQAIGESVGPKIILGNPQRPVGKIFVEMTGGTEGSKEVFDKLYKLGIRTLVSMHLSEEHFKKVRDNNLNVVVAGHISSDTLGLNLLLDAVERRAKEKLAVISCSGFRRFSRNK